MPELYVFIASVLLLVLIVWRRRRISAILRKIAFKEKIAVRLEELKQEERKSPEKRFKESFEEERKQQKFDLARYKEALRKAEMTLSQKEWEQAESWLIKALALAQQKTPVLLKLAELYQGSGDIKRAEALYNELLENEPRQGGVVHEALARIYGQKKRYKEAVSHYVKAVESDPKNDKALWHLGKLYRLLMRPGLAAECFRRAAELRPREVEYLFLLAEACSADEDHENAFNTYEKILTLEPYNEKARAAAQEMRLKMKEAEVTIRKISERKAAPNPAAS